MKICRILILMMLLHCCYFVAAVEVSLVSMEKLVQSQSVKLVIKIALEAKEKAIFEESLQLSHNDSRFVIEQQKILTTSVLEYLPHVKRSEQVFNDIVYSELIVSYRSHNFQAFRKSFFCVSCIVLLHDHAAIAQARVVSMDKLLELVQQIDQFTPVVIKSPDCVAIMNNIEPLYQNALSYEVQDFFAMMIRLIERMKMMVVILFFILMLGLLYVLCSQENFKNTLLCIGIPLGLLALVTVASLYAATQLMTAYYSLVALLAIILLLSYATWRYVVIPSSHMAYAIISHVTLFAFIPLLLHTIFYWL